MTSATGNRKDRETPPGVNANRRGARRAFTLIEVSLALFIVLLIVAAVIPLTSGWLSEDRLRQPAHQLELFAKTARSLALAERRPYEIRFSEEGFLMQAMPLEEAGESTNQTKVLDYVLPKSVHCRLQRWRDPEWGVARDQQWTFQPTGLCDPLRIRFSSGEDWLQLSFNPMTAGSQDEAYFFH